MPLKGGEEEPRLLGNKSRLVISFYRVTAIRCVAGIALTAIQCVPGIALKVIQCVPGIGFVLTMSC